MIVLPVQQRRTHTGGAEPVRHLHAREADTHDDYMLLRIGAGHGRRNLFVIALTRIHGRMPDLDDIKLTGLGANILQQPLR